MSVAITPDQGLALVTSSTKKDPADTTKTVPDNRVSVVDLRATPPAVIATLEGTVSVFTISADSRTILVQNMADKDIQVLRWDGTNLQDTGQRIKTNGGPAGIRTISRP